MHKADKRSRQLRLTRQRQDGADADVLMEQIGPFVATLQQKYYKQLVTNTREKGEIDALTVHTMIGLDDFLQELRTAIARATRAQAKIDKQAGDSE